MKYSVVNLNPSLHGANESVYKLFESIEARIEEKECISEEEVIDFAKFADAVITTRTPITRKIMENLDKCKVIARFGSGIDNIDLDFATLCNIAVINVMDFCTEDVSNHALMFILACSKKLIQHDKMVHEGGWGIDTLNIQESIHCGTLGLVGFGRIAISLAKKANVLGMKVLAYDPHVEESKFHDYGVRNVSLNQLLKESDFVSLHTPLTNETKGLIGWQQLRLMKTTAYLINCARGSVVDEIALIKALGGKIIAGAALDCLAEEPPQKTNPLLKLKNVILTPHIAAYSKTSLETVRHMVFIQVAQILTGQRPKFICNPEVLQKINLNSESNSEDSERQ